MGKVSIGINGFGGAGPLVAGVALRRDDVERVAVDAPFITTFTTTDSMTGMFKYDSVHGQGNHPELQVIFIHGKPAFLVIRNPGEIPWVETGDEVIDEFTEDEDKAAALFKTDMFKYDSFHGQRNHPELKAISFHGKPFAVLGIRYCEEIPWVEIGAEVFDEFTEDEDKAAVLLEVCFNIIPSSTGAAKAVGKVLPAINGKLTGMAFRVPTVDVSVVDLTVRLDKAATYDEIKAAIKEEFDGNMNYTDDDVVSIDFVGDNRSSIFDAKAGIALSPNFAKLGSCWYDKEWGYSSRVIDSISATWPPFREHFWTVMHFCEHFLQLSDGSQRAFFPAMFYQSMECNAF